MRFLKIATTALLVAVSGTSTVAQEQYIRLTADHTAIRSASSATAQLVAMGRKGDVFELSSEEPGWFEVYMFSGEARFVAKSAAQVADYKRLLPKSVARRQEIFRALSRTEDRSRTDADRKYPVASSPSAVDTNIEYMRILDDRYKLEVMHQFEVQSPIYATLVVEGVKAGWR